MKINLMEYGKMLTERDISIFYSGPVWADGIDGLAEFLLKRLDMDEIPLSASQSVFSVFVEQLNNLLMYSTEKEHFEYEEKPAVSASRGVFVMGKTDGRYFVQTGNLMKNSSVELLKNRIDHLNTLDKQQLRQFLKEQRRAENDNPESRGAGIGLIEVARRATSKIDYDLIPCGEGSTYFSMYVTV
jgi:hypothetical protein